MAPFFSSVTTLALLALAIAPSTAHFLLQYPPTIGFDDTLEATAPCGSFTVDFSKDNVTNFHVAGDAIAVTSIHPQATWLFRATLDQNATSNWTALLADVTQTGLGDFCEPAVTVPSSWAGQKGVIGVVQDAPDGILYQCAAVNFVSGSQAPPSICKNVTGLLATFTSDLALATLPASGSVSGAPTTTASSSSTAAAATTSVAAASLTAIYPYGVVGSLVWAGMVVLATMGFFLA